MTRADRLTREELAREVVHRDLKPENVPHGWWDGPGATRVPSPLLRELSAIAARLAAWRPGT